MVLIGYPGHLDMLVLGLLARLARRWLVFDPLVTLTDTLVEDRGLVAPGSARARLIGAVDRAALRLAHVVLADTEENAAYMQALAPATRARFVVVPVGADEQLFSPDRGPAPPVSWPEHPPGALRVLFYGTFIPLHGPETIVRAAAYLDPRSTSLVMVGQGQLWSQTRALATCLGVPNVAFVHWVPYHELPAWISQADVVLGIFGETSKAARVIPNKVYQAMAMGAALVTRDSPPVRRLLEHGRSALLVPPADPIALARALEALRDRAARRRLGQAARHAFLRFARGEVVAARLADALPPVAGSSRPVGLHGGAPR
jgi:glycosyltransferase involved in cell wall biosynthesis